MSWWQRPYPLHVSDTPHQAGGGGGSYVSRWISEVDSATIAANEPATEATVTLTPLRIKRKPSPAFNIYVWLTTYNMLRITNGRGALMFSV